MNLEMKCKTLSLLNSHQLV